MKPFTTANEKVVRIQHELLGQELVDIARDLDIPLQHVFNALTIVLVEYYDIDAILTKTVAQAEEKTHDWQYLG